MTLSENFANFENGSSIREIKRSQNIILLKKKSEMVIFCYIVCIYSNQFIK